MARYVDGFVLPVSRRKLAAYAKVSSKAGRVWKQYGALEYVECVIDDLPKSWPYIVRQDRQGQARRDGGVLVDRLQVARASRRGQREGHGRPAHAGQRPEDHAVRSPSAWPWPASRRSSISRCPSRPRGILLYRRGPRGLEVLLAHPGGPLWAKKDLGAWTLPKGQFTDDEWPIAAAKREFEEEMGSAPSGEFVESDRSSSRAARSFTCSSPNRTSTSRRCRATCSRWSGRRNPGSTRSFRKSIARGGFRSMRRGRKS